MSVYGIRVYATYPLSAPLHDIGKVGTPDHILHKPGRLTAEEFEVMKEHSAHGRAAIEAAEAVMDNTTSFLTDAKDIAFGHHERWDGTGYPSGAAGEAIPLSARIMAVADVYDAIISKRVYKPAMSHQEAVAEIAAGRGTHFDPAVVDAFLSIAESFRAIAARYEDGLGTEIEVASQ